MAFVTTAISDHDQHLNVPSYNIIILLNLYSDMYLRGHIKERSRSNQEEPSRDEHAADDGDVLGLDGGLVAEPAPRGRRHRVHTAIDHEHQSEDYVREFELKHNTTIWINLHVEQEEVTHSSHMASLYCVCCHCNVDPCS